MIQFMMKRGMRLKTHTFRGGTHPIYEKEISRYFKIKEIEPPSILIVSMNQHAGTRAKPIVKVGDYVTKGEKIAEGDGAVSANIHAPVSGKVKEIRPNMHPSGITAECIIIENDHKNKLCEKIKKLNELESLSPQTILDAIREAGIVGMGGGEFPTHAKLTITPDKHIKHSIINGAESDPHLTADHRMILENPEKVLHGCLAVMRVVGAEKGYIAIEKNKPDAIEGMRQYLKSYNNINVCALETKYPQGSEKQLVEAVLGIKTPQWKQPADLGVIVNNVSTVAAISDCLTTGMPLINRVITLCGDAFETAQNYLVPIGTTIRHVIKEHGGFKRKPERVLVGGSMQGVAQCTLDTPIVKGSNSILALTSKETAKSKPTACIRCGRCITSCPVNLHPMTLAKLSKIRNKEGLKKYNVSDCIECGTCSYVCPAKIHLLQYIKIGKEVKGS
jgi:electron transport complex protein RnfC